jgi:site-specific DNA-cytosine methylase
MRILVACEYSGIVRDAFIAMGHDAVSCDLLPTEAPGPHYHGDVRDILNDGWDLMIAHPPCTHLAVSGARWFKDKKEEQKQALEFVRLLLDAPIERIALENPVSVISTQIRKPDQIIQPYEHGHEATKTTCLWLKNLPLLMPTKVVGKGERHITRSGRSLPSWYNLPPSKDRWKVRSKMFEGIALAMAQQWGGE